MSNSISVTTTKSWGSRLMESIKGVLAGLLLFIVSFPLLWWNEGRAVQTYKSLQEGRGAVVTADAAKVDAANEAKLVHLSGLATTEETLTDPVLNVQAVQAIRLSRDVEMYQWVEEKHTETKKKTGGSEETVTTYTYAKEWRSDPVDSSGFFESEGHENPGSMEFSSETWAASNVTLGSFGLSEGLAKQMSESQELPFTEEMFTALPSSLTGREGVAPAPTPAEEEQPAKAVAKGKGKGKGKAALAKGKGKGKAKKSSGGGEATVAASAGRAKVHGGGLYVGSDPANPRVGDLRMKWSKVIPGQVSVIAQQTGNKLAGYQTKAGDVLEMLSAGSVSADQMFAQAEAANAMLTWILRLLGFILMFAGVALVLRPLAVFGDVIPVIGGFLRVGIGLVALAIALPLSLTTIAISWLFYRPALGVILLVVAVGSFVGIKVLVGKKKKPEEEQAAPSEPAASA